MQTGLKSFLGDPALTAMGLVPARYAPSAPAAPGSLSWRYAWVSLGIGVVFVIGLFRDTALHIVTTWNASATFNHGFLILPICFYLIWLKRGALASCAPRPLPLAALGMLAAGLGWLAGYVGGVAVVQQFALVVMIQTLFITILGLRLSRLLFFPLLYLFFAVPFGEALIPPLQDLTAVFAVSLLRLLDVPVFHDGIIISIPAANFLVAEACSGVRFLIATLALGFLFAHLTYRSVWRKSAFMVCALVVPIIANGFRAFGIVYIAHMTDGEVAVGVDHIVYGWMFFAIVTVILLGIGMTFRDHGGVDETVMIDGGTSAAAHLAAPRHIIFAAVLALLAAAAGPVYAMVIDARPAQLLAGALSTPKPGGGWRLAGLSSGGWSPRFPDAHARLLRTYVKDGREVRLFIAYYNRQRQDAEMIGARNSIMGGEGWARTGAGVVGVRLAGHALDVNRMRMVRRGRGRVVYQWYWIADQQTPNSYLAKFLQTRQVLLGASEAAAVIIVSSVYQDQPDDADPVLRDFMASLPPLESWLGPAARGG